VGLTCVKKNRRYFGLGGRWGLVLNVVSLYVSLDETSDGE